VITFIAIFGIFLLALVLFLSARGHDEAIVTNNSDTFATTDYDFDFDYDDDLSEPWVSPVAHSLVVNTNLHVDFSHESGFYDIDFHLVLTGPEGADIFFTMDGSYPTLDSFRFRNPLFMESPRPRQPLALFDVNTISGVTVRTIRAIAVLDGEASDIITHNFVMGTDVFTRFTEDTLVFVLTSDPHGLFDHYDGILVAGVDREVWRQDFYNRRGFWPVHGYSGDNEQPSSPANFNRRGRESERDMHVQMFDNTGTLHISQRAGTRVRGGFSRAHEPQKSLELFARNSYGDSRIFDFPFFDNEFDYAGNLITEYRRIRLRNGGSDRYAGFIRDELAQELFRQAGFPTTQTHRPAAVFLNGEYYGVAWLKSPRTYDHLVRLHGGGDVERFAIIGGGDTRFIPSWWVGEAHATADMREIHELARAGFVGESGEARFEEFSHRICIDELILYYALQVYINNSDWPNHNIELWRYFPTEEEKNDESLHPFLRDGRWRVFAHDIEAGLAIWDNEANSAREDTLMDIINGTGNRWNSGNGSAIAHAFVEFPYTRQRLAETFEWLIEGVMAPENIIRTLDELEERFRPEHEFAMRMDVIIPDSPWWPSPEGVAESRDGIRRFAELRPYYIMRSVETNLR